MSFTPARLFLPTLLTTSAADLYTNGTGRNVLLRQVIVVNNTASAATARLSLTPSGQSRIDGAFIPDYSVPAHDEIVLDLFQVLAAGDKLNGLAGTGSALTITGSGFLL